MQILDHKTQLWLTMKMIFWTIKSYVMKHGFPISHPKTMKIRNNENTFFLMMTVLETNLKKWWLFWNRRGVLLVDYLLYEATMISQKYCEYLNNLRKTIQNRCRGLLTREILFLQDNAHLHTAKLTIEHSTGEFCRIHLIHPTSEMFPRWSTIQYWPDNLQFQPGSTNMQ